MCLHPTTGRPYGPARPFERSFWKGNAQFSALLHDLHDLHDLHGFYILHGLNVLHGLHGFYTLHGLNVLHDLHGLHDSPERRLPANHAQPKNHANHAFHSFRAAPDTQKTPEVHTSGVSFARSRHLPIFTGRVQPTIFGTSELNFCVRNGNRWGLTVIDTGRPEYINQLALLSFPDVSRILF